MIENISFLEIPFSGNNSPYLIACYSFSSVFSSKFSTTRQEVCPPSLVADKLIKNCCAHFLFTYLSSIIVFYLAMI